MRFLPFQRYAYDLCMNHNVSTSFWSMEMSVYINRVFVAHYASKNADWNKQQVTEGGILANRNSANHPYCSYAIRKKSRFWLFCMWFVKELYHALLPKTDYRDKGRGHDRRLAGKPFPFSPPVPPSIFFLLPLLLPRNKFDWKRLLRKLQSLQCKLMQVPSFSV